MKAKGTTAMTLFGKLLTMLTLIASLVMMGWSLSLYTNRTDWSDRKATADQPEGELSKRKTRLDRLWKGMAAPEAAFREASIGLAALESRRPGDRKWYAERLEQLRTGPTPTQAVVLGANSLPQIGPDGRPTLAPARDAAGQPLLFQRQYEDDARSTDTTLKQLGTKYEMLKADALALTNQLTGENGLPQRVLREQAKLESLQKEYKFLEPVFVDTLIQKEKLEERRKELVQRLDQLKKGVVSKAQ